jgi:hypothetical protein
LLAETPPSSTDPSDSIAMSPLVRWDHERGQYKIGSHYLTNERTIKYLSEWYKDKCKRKNKREKRKKKLSNKVSQLRDILVEHERERKEFLKDDDLGPGWHKNRDVQMQLDEMGVDISGSEEEQFSWRFYFISNQVYR